MNRTTLGVGHFKTVSGHFFANCINSFHKTEDLTVILRGPTLFFNILIWSKTSFFASSLLLVFCNFVRKKKENLWLINGHFMTISGHFFANYIKIFHKTEIQTVILRCLVCLNPDWIKSNDIISVEIFFFQAWKCIISGLVCRSEFWQLLRKSALIFSKWLFFQNSLKLSWLT